MFPLATRAAAVLVFAPMLVLAGDACAQGSKPTPIDVQLSDYRFTPTHIDLNSGQAYLLRLTNSSKHGHDLSAKAFFQAASLGRGGAAKVDNGEIEVAGGETVEVELTPGKPGSYEMHCPRPFHSMFGMSGKILVH
jgi:uncharacterized cupredoxin-like copper-binding protein